MTISSPDFSVSVILSDGIRCPSIASEYINASSTNVFLDSSLGLFEQASRVKTHGYRSAMYRQPVSMDRTKRGQKAFVPCSECNVLSLDADQVIPGCILKLGRANGDSIGLRGCSSGVVTGTHKGIEASICCDHKSRECAVEDEVASCEQDLAGRRDNSVGCRVGCEKNVRSVA